MNEHMPLPKFYGLVRIVAQIGAFIGCAVGIFAIIGGISVFQLGVAQGIAAISGGIYTVLLSLAGLGVAYGFLAIVKAQIDSRNTLVTISSGTNLLHSNSGVARQEPRISGEGENASQNSSLPGRFSR